MILSVDLWPCNALFIGYLFMISALDFEGFYNSEGRLSTPSAAPEWERPIRVELCPVNALALRRLNFGSELHIETSQRELFKAISPSRVVRPTPDLLERFISLAEEGEVQIHKFAKKYGGLEIFFHWSSKGVHIEYCSVWQYFARVMKAALKISGNLYARQPLPAGEWKSIGRIPEAMRSMEEGQEQYRRIRSGIPEMEEWCAIAGYLRSSGRPYPREARPLFVRVLNTLLGLGMVRPWIVWPDNQQASRPQLVYSGRSLMSALALQLCLRVAKIKSFVICSHCQQSYLPEKRAPKTGQRNFCPECRKNGVPQQYASISFRERRRDKGDRADTYT
jgi:hypothetical protein